MSYKYAGFSGPHPSLVVDCPACGSPTGYFCNGTDGGPTDRPCTRRRLVAGTARFVAARSRSGRRWLASRMADGRYYLHPLGDDVSSPRSETTGKWQGGVRGLVRTEAELLDTKRWRIG